jgi:hypothetical protein
MTSSICGFAGEAIATRLFRSANLKPVAFSQPRLLSILKSSKLGQRRLSQSLPYMLAEWMEVAQIPSGVVLDYAYGIDAVINFRGHIIGIDVTVNSSALHSKAQKLEQLRPLWTAAGIDHTIALHIDPSTATPEALIAAIRTAIKSSTTQAIAI